MQYMYAREISIFDEIVDAGRPQLDFIASHHKTGTTLLKSILPEHPDVSSFKSTRVPSDEGQHLHSIIKPANFYGGPERYFSDLAFHLNEKHPTATEQTAIAIENQWLPYHDVSKLVFLEKSPPNLVQTRFLKAYFQLASS